MKINEIITESSEQTVDEGKTGLWANIHAKQERIKGGSGERMRKPGTKGAPTAANFKAAAASEGVTTEMVGYTQSNNNNQSSSKQSVPLDRLPKDNKSQLQRMKDGGKQNWFALEGVAEGSDNILPRGTSVTVVHKGKQVSGKIVRYDSGKGGYSDAYVVDIGGYESIFVPASKIQQQTMSEGVAETLLMNDALKVLRRYGADNFRTTSNTLTFYKKGRPSVIDLVWNDDGTRSVKLSQLNSATHQLKGQGIAEDWQKTNKQDKTDGMSSKAVKAYRRENPGSKLKTAVTKKPSKLKAGSKDANRRKSFCARMSGNKGPMKDEKGRPTPKAKALKRWNCNEDTSE
jgi:hypothetical protein